MLNVEKFFDDLSLSIYLRPRAIEAALTSAAQEHWLATEASILLNVDRDRYGIGGFSKNKDLCIPKWWVAREAGLIDLFVAPENLTTTKEKNAFAFEFKVIRSEGYKYKRQLDELWWQISGERNVHKNYVDGFCINWYGIVLAFDTHYAAGCARVKKPKSLFDSDGLKSDFFDQVWGVGVYENWAVLKGWEVWSSKRSEFPQYLDSKKESSVKIFLVKGKVCGGADIKSIPRPSEIQIQCASFINK